MILGLGLGSLLMSIYSWSLCCGAEVGNEDFCHAHTASYDGGHARGQLGCPCEKAGDEANEVGE
jgi:hypothetical protein